KNLYNAWITTSELHDSITIKRIKLHLLRQNLKLTSILKGQMSYLKEWALMDRDYSSSLSGAVEALEASTLRLPVVGGARADIQNVMDAIGSAVSVMQAMVSSLCPILSKVEEVNSLMSELVNATAEERALLVQCRDHLSILSAMQVKDCSLRTHIVQVKRVSTTS
ncbi:Qwrf motif-containing protein, partial [Thalictrum thalictroides]